MTDTIILLYHDLDERDNPTEKRDLPTQDTVVRCEEFKNQMHYLVSKGYRGLSIQQYLDERKNDTDNERKIVLTFDDGHISNYRFALPILRECSYTATFFIIVDKIGQPYHMGIPELKELLGYNMEIGSHGLTHAYLPELRHEDINREVKQSKNLLETYLGHPIEVFAYPGGHVTREVLECVKHAGYEAAASCVVGQNNPQVDPFLLRRLEIRRGTSLKAFQRALSTKNILFFRGIDLSKTLIKKTIGLSRYERIRQKFYHLYPFVR